MKRRQFLAGVGAAPLLGAVPAQSAPKRNLVLFVVDAMRSEMMGCAGNKVLQTPNIDRVASRGTIFTNAFCPHGVCMPNRASIFTGRYPGAHGVWANGVTLSKNERTLAHVLDENGWATGSAGKHHFEAELAPQYPPQLKPGESYYGFRETHLAENVPGAGYIAYLKKNFPQYSDSFRKVTLPPEAHQIHWIVSQTENFLSRQRKAGSPFFAYCSFPDLSPRDTPPLDFDKMYKPADMPMPKRRAGELDRKPPHYRKVYENQLAKKRYPNDEQYRELMALYYGQMSFVDQQLGRLVRAVEQAGQLENTMFVITTDHGLCLGDHWIWRHGPWLYDQVTHVPLVISCPWVSGPRAVQEMVEHVDIMPTILDCLGVPVPEGVQGRSLRALLAGQAGARGKDTVWADDREAYELEASGISHQGFHVMSVRSRNWKYVHYAGKPYGELYDLRNDPDEFENLWDSPDHRGLRNECRDVFLERLIATRDPLPAPVAHW